MNDKELADAVVALGIGTQVDYPKSSDGVGFYHTPEDDCGESDGVYSKLFVRDWRVAGALMEKAAESGNQVLSWKDDGLFICDLPNVGDEILFDFARNDSLPRAIIEACVEALT